MGEPILSDSFIILFLFICIALHVKLIFLATKS